MLRNFANVPIAISVKCEQENNAFKRECKKESIFVCECDDEDFTDKNDVYPLCYLINKTDTECSTLWFELKRAILENNLRFTVVDFANLISLQPI